MNAQTTAAAEATASAVKRGRAAAVSDDEVIAVGEQLQRDGKRVSGYLIRAALGGVGRTDRYNELWAKHVAARASSEAETSEQPAAVSLSPEIRAALDEAQGSIGSALEALALAVQRSSNTVSAQAVADADRRAAEAEAARAEAEAAGESAMDELQSAVEQLNSELENARSIAHGALEQIAAERATSAAATARAEERERVIKALEAQIEMLKKGV